MRLQLTFALIFIAGSFAGEAVTQQSSKSAPQIKLAQQKGDCPQIIHCGTKNGGVKEYPTKCAAEADGATNIVPKTGPACPANQ